MSEIKNVRQTWLAKCNQLTALPYKGLTDINSDNGCSAFHDKYWFNCNLHHDV